MIFVTIGTSEPFDRLLGVVAECVGDERVIVQCGASSFRPEGVEYVDFLPYDALVDHVRRARAVIAHAGVGTVMTVLANGKRPIVMPRLRRFGEAVDDHQVTFAQELAAKGVIHVVNSPSDLSEILGGSDLNGVRLGPQSALAADIRAYLIAEKAQASARPEEAR